VPPFTPEGKVAAVKKKKVVLIIAVTTAFVVLSLYAEQKHKQSTAPAYAVVNQHGEELVAQGRQIFRFDTFGDQDFWGGALQLHKALEEAQHGGVGPGVSPATALAVGLKVDLDALPPALVRQIKAGQVNLNDPAIRLDGWANRDLNVGAIVALSPNLQPIADLLGVDRQILTF
jgi:hypothetical protein